MSMLTGIILAGGRNDYVNGHHRSLLLHHNEPIILCQIKKMSQIADEVIIVTNTPRELLPHVPTNIRIITDFYPNRGPIGGLHAGLSLARTEIAWVIEVDTLSISTSITSKLIKNVLRYHADGAIPLVDGTLKPLQGVYRTSTKATLTKLLQQENTTLSTFLENIHTVSVSSNSNYKIRPHHTPQ